MEGDGPCGGGPKKPAGADRSAAEPATPWTMPLRGLMGHYARQVATVRLARARGLFGGEVVLTGPNRPPRIPALQRPRSPPRWTLWPGVPGPLRRWSRWVMRTRFPPDRWSTPPPCVGCGRCSESCPSQVIRLEGAEAHMPERALHPLLLLPRDVPGGGHPRLQKHPRPGLKAREGSPMDGSHLRRPQPRSTSLWTLWRNCQTAIMRWTW